MASKFRQILKGVLNKEVIIPRLNTYLYNPSFPGFEVPMAGFEKRIPDGYFHPSEHPTWPERQLYFYAKDPHSLVAEPMDPVGTMAVTQGNFWHAFVQTCGLDDGFLRIMTPEAKTAHDKAEFKVEDTILGTSGYMDGVLNSDELAIETDEGFEFKTMVGAKMNGCPKGEPADPDKLAWFKVKCAQYFGQAQEYMRMSGYRNQRVLIMSAEYPYPKIEILVPFDQVYSSELVDKYRRVRQAAAEEGQLPAPCCGTMDHKVQLACPARLVCPVAKGGGILWT